MPEEIVGTGISQKCADIIRTEEGTDLGKKVLAIGYDKNRTGNIQWDPFNYDDIVHMLSTMPEAIAEIAGEQKYLLIMVFWNSSYDIFALKNIRSLTNAPILILAEKYNGVEKAGFLEAGADEYIPYPETVQEVAASCKALIRRYTILNQSPDIPMSHVLQGDVFVDKDYRRIYVCGQEINLARREFEVFNLLASHPERVYTYEQLSSQMGEGENIALENSIHSCIRRIRRKLENVPECTCYIGNKRGIGYYFRQNICETG